MKKDRQEWSAHLMRFVLKIEQAIAAKVTEIYSIWTKPANNLEPAKRKLKIAMQPYMELAAQEFQLTGEPAVRFAFAHKMVEQICLGFYKTNLDLFDVGNITTKLTLYSWIIDDATVKAHLVNSGNSATPHDIEVARPGLIKAATEVPQRVVQRRSRWFT